MDFDITMIKTIFHAFLQGLALLLFSQLSVAGIIGSKHDLSDFSDPNRTDEICVFCHTPHGANVDLDMYGHHDDLSATRSKAPLWNRGLSDVSVFEVYTSPTMNAVCDDTPSPLSLACLSCHDAALDGWGTTGAVTGTDQHTLMNWSNADSRDPRCGSCHQGEDGTQNPAQWFQIGPDVSNEHPISMSYELARSSDPYFNTPPSAQSGWPDVKLFNGRVECPSCHNPHDPTNVPFLRKSMAGSGLCYVCHNK